MAYELAYGRIETQQIHRELENLLNDSQTKRDCCRLLAVVTGIAELEEKGCQDNIHARVGVRNIYCISLSSGKCAIFYAYGPKSSRTIYLLSCGLNSDRDADFLKAANRIGKDPTE